MYVYCIEVAAYDEHLLWGFISVRILPLKTAHSNAAHLVSLVYILFKTWWKLANTPYRLSDALKRQADFASGL